MLLAAGLSLTGCAALEPAGEPAGLPSVELTHVPFFPQSRYQCGPAALATTLGATGIGITPDALTDQVFVPGRRGSFQVELKAASRRFGRIPFELEGGLDELIAEVSAGRPVLVLQNLAFGFAPRWHYAVVVGFEPARDRVVLRSGRTERHLERLPSFLRTWALADDWGMVLLAPGELPAHGDPAAYLTAVVAASADLTLSQQAAALRAGIDAWPDHADLAFAAANVVRAQGGDSSGAVRLYRRTLALVPSHLGALNNLADLASTLGCREEALVLINRAIASADPDSALRAVLDQTRSEVLAGPHDGGAACTVLRDG